MNAPATNARNWGRGADPNCKTSLTSVIGCSLNAPGRPRAGAKVDPGRFVERDTHSRIPLGHHRTDLWRIDAVYWPLVAAALGRHRHHLSRSEREWVALKPGSVESRRRAARVIHRLLGSTSACPRRSWITMIGVVVQ